MVTKKEIRTLVLETILSKSNIDLRNNIYIFSDRRSGGTWLMELFNQIPNTATIWEPLNETHGVGDASWNFNGFLHFQEFMDDDENLINLKLFEKILTGKRINYWITSHSKFTDYLKSNQLIIKFIRANAILPWFVNNIDLKYSPVHLLRHPLAIANSQIKTFLKGNESISKFFIPCQKYNTIYTQHEKLLAELSSPIEIIVAGWCIHNQLLLNNRNLPEKWVTLHYEDLIMNPRKEIEMVFSNWKIPIPPGIFEKINIPSASNYHGYFSDNRNIQLSKWEDEILGKDKERAQAILDYFQIEQYSAFSSYPIYRKRG